MTESHRKLIEKVQSFFSERFSAINAPIPSEAEIRVLLENPLFTHHIFPNNVVAVLNQSNGTYLYWSGSEMWGIQSAEFKEKGMAFTLSLMPQEDLSTLQFAFEKATNIISQLMLKERMYIHFNYDIRLNTPFGVKHIFQQTIPLALNGSGMPFLVLAIGSDVSEYTHKGIHYKLSLGMPGKPIKILLSGSSKSPSPLSERERQVVLQIAEGNDSKLISENLFISHDTVRTHRKNILEKTGAKNTADLVRLAVANGWI